MNRGTLQQLAEVRLREASALLDADESSGAYYLCGYAIECALKACIARETQEYDWPDKERVNNSHTHNVSVLLGLAGLVQEPAQQSQALRANWGTVKDWNERSRYDLKTPPEAYALYVATADANDGVLQWLKLHW